MPIAVLFLDRYRFSLLSARTRRSCWAQQCAARAAEYGRAERAIVPSKLIQLSEFRSRCRRALRACAVRAWFPRGGRGAPDNVSTGYRRFLLGRVIENPKLIGNTIKTSVFNDPS